MTAIRYLIEGRLRYANGATRFEGDGYREVVLASDYDALFDISCGWQSDYALAQDRLRTLEAELADWQRMRNEAMAQATFNRNGIERLETALRKWSESCTGLHGSQMKCVNETLQDLALTPQSETDCESK